MNARRRATVIAVVAAAFVVLGGPAHAQVSVDEGLAELDRARALVDRSLEVYTDGDAEQAYLLSRNAYLDHFEFVEIPLRVRDEGLTLELEEDFATHRNLIEAGAPVGEVEDVTAELRRGLDAVERELTAPGLAAPLIAVVSSFVILFREGLEAVLIVAAVLGYLEASRNIAYRGAVLKGVGAAAVATVVTFIAATLFIRLAPVQRELLEGVTAVLAVGVLFYVSFWLVARLDQRRWMEFVKSKVWTAATTGSTLALAGVGFTAVFREGFEIVLFYQALISFAQGLELWLVLGALAALAALGAIGFAIFRAGRRLPIKPMLTGAVLMIMVLSVAFVGNAVRALQEAAVLDVTFLEEWPRLPIFLADLTGWHPTRESLIAQAVLAAIYVLGAIWMFVVVPRRERRAGELEPSEPTHEAASDRDQVPIGK